MICSDGRVHLTWPAHTTDKCITTFCYCFGHDHSSAAALPTLAANTSSHPMFPCIVDYTPCPPHPPHPPPQALISYQTRRTCTSGSSTQTSAWAQASVCSGPAPTPAAGPPAGPCPQQQPQQQQQLQREDLLQPLPTRKRGGGGWRMRMTHWVVVMTSYQWAGRTRQPTQATLCACGALRPGASSWPMRAAARYGCTAINQPTSSCQPSSLMQGLYIPLLDPCQKQRRSLHCKH